ncbi:MAG: PAS domain S-box protein [Opitutaceae bacterium]|nr:PAS domain S-box protein [Opitutaceae bacterium]
MISGSSKSTAPKDSQASTVALLWLDPEGRIRSANAAAAALWRTSRESLAGSLFVSVLAWEVTSTDPDWRHSQWEVLQSAARGGPVQVHAQPYGGGDAIPVSVALDEASGQDSGFFAAILVSDSPPESASHESPSTSPQSEPAQSPAVAGLSTGTESLPAGSALNWLVTEAPVGFFDLDFVLGYAHYSPTWKRMLGYEDSDLPNTFETWHHLLHPDDSAAAPDRIGRNPGRESSRSFALDYRMQHRRGHYIWMHGIGLQRFGPDSRLERVLGIQIDITDRKELEEETLGAEERLRHLTSHGLIGAFDLDFVKQSHWFSAGWRTLFAQPENEPARLHEPLWPLLDVLPPGQAQTGSAWLSEYRPGDNPVLEGITLKRRDGLAVPVLLGITRHFSRKQELVRAMGFAIPLDADAASVRIGRSLPPVNLLAPALDALAEAVIVADANGNVAYLNSRAEQLTGHTARGDGILTLTEVLPLVRRGDNQPAHEALATQLASADPQALCQDHALAPLGERTEPLPIVWNARQIWDAKGRIAGVVVIVRDPRELSLRREEMVHTNRLETLARLAHGISADYNNQLTTVLGAISQAKENRDLSHLASAERACLEASDLSRQLLTLSSQQAPAGKTLCSAAEIARDAARLAASGCPARIEFDFPEDLPSIHAERPELVQAVQNLVLNAIDALQEDPARGTIRLRGSRVNFENNEVPPLPAGSYVQIEVQDNGSGIAPDDLERIFEPFFTTRPNRTGLGLATAQSIIHRHGGQIWASSLPGAGATFTFCLPASAPVSEAPVPTAPALRFGTGRVLFMDDDAAICALTAGMLTSLDYTYDLARNGEEAIALYRRYFNVGRPYDAVILDLNVAGGMGGDTCFQELMLINPEVRAIIASGYDDPVLRERFLAMGFAAYLTKPYRLADLSRALGSALGPSSDRFRV